MGCCTEKQSNSLRGAASLLAALPLLIATGCRQDMHDQPKFVPQRGTTFFADGRSARPQVEGTVARSQGDAGSYLLTGLIDGKEGDALPFAATPDVLARGQERYNIYCTPCHSRVGNGLGMIVQRGYYPAGNFHTLRLQSAPLGHFFNVMTNGYGAMPDYSAQLTPQDRWAVAAYIRALQLSQHASKSDVPAGANVERLLDIATREGLPESYTQPWSVPSMALAPATAAPASATIAAAVSATVPASAPPAAVPGTPAAVVAPPIAKDAAGPVSPAATKPGAVTTPTATATTTAKSATPTVVAPPVKAAPTRDVAAGQALYLKNCSMCHQPTRTGIPPTIPALLGIVDKVGEDHIRSVVHSGIPTGKPPMPSFEGKLSDADIENILGFLNTPGK